MPICPICPRECRLNEGQVGFCRARACQNGIIVPINYGQATSVALDPIEKKPLYHFYHGSKILSYGSFGCNLRCPFCQNYQISMAGQNQIVHQYIAPRELVALAVKLAREPAGNLGVAFTYNEPLICPEYIKDCAVLLQESGLKTVLVSNGHVNNETFNEILPYIDAINIDLKGFTQDYYDYVGGNLECVKQNIAAAYNGKCHVEVTTLVVPTKNDSVAEMEAEAAWLASLSPDIPLHLSRYFPRYQCEIPTTQVETLYHLHGVARKYLRFVYIGNC